MNEIKSITIKNIKGICDYTFTFKDLIPNKPHIFVAPNGFGKTSFATAFKSLNASRIVLDERVRCLLDNSRKAEISLCYSSNGVIKTCSATEEKGSNTISKNFEVFVINSSIFPHASKRKIGGVLTVSSEIKIEDIRLIPVVERRLVDYKVSSLRSKLGDNGRVVVKNLEKFLRKEDLSIWRQDVDWDLISRKHTSTWRELCDCVRNGKGERNIRGKILREKSFETLRNNEQIRQVMMLIRQSDQSMDEVDAMFCLWQLREIYATQKQEFRKMVEYYRYLDDKKYLTIKTKDFNSSWKEVFPVEKDGGVVVRFPSADLLSNGQRDNLVFSLMLEKAKRQFRRNSKKECLLIIDEVFDYLDDANLVALQFYVSELIADLKKQERNLYPILLTHLDPNFFNHFCFKKMKVHYLIQSGENDDLGVKELIKQRENPKIKDKLDSCFFHYNPEHATLEKEFAELKLRKNLADSFTFRADLYRHVKERYLAGKKYDSFSVCVALRLKVEEKIYSKLSANLKSGFLGEHGTRKKLDLAEANGIEVPEVYYFLGIIYNTALHGKTPNPAPLSSKLNNVTIRRMIKSIFQED